MDRRGFLKRLIGGVAVAAFTPYEILQDPGKALWSPGTTTIFLPPEHVIVAPPKPEIFDDCVDLNRALTDPEYYASQIIGTEIASGYVPGFSFDEYITRRPPRPNKFLDPGLCRNDHTRYVM